MSKTFKQAFNEAYKQGVGTTFTWNGNTYSAIKDSDLDGNKWDRNNTDFQSSFTNYLNSNPDSDTTRYYKNLYGTIGDNIWENRYVSPNQESISNNEESISNNEIQNAVQKAVNPTQQVSVQQIGPEKIEIRTYTKQKPYTPYYGNTPSTWLHGGSKEDLKELHFNDYYTLVNAVKANPKNVFAQDLVLRFGDPNTWDQKTVEKALGVSGKYRSFGRGDYGDILRSMEDYTKYHDDTPFNFYNRSQVRYRMRNLGLNPYDFSGAERNALRKYLNGDTEGKSFDINLLKNNQILRDKFNLKFQSGGKMNDIEQQVVDLVQAAMQGDQQATQQIQSILNAAKQGDQQALQIAQMIQQVIQQMKGVQSAKNGSKLDYIKYLRGKCPEGYEISYYKQGGHICKKCMKAKEKSDSSIAQFKQNHKSKKGCSGIKFAESGAKVKDKKGYPLVENGKTVYYKDEATRDSIAVNRYNDQELQASGKGEYKKDAKGQIRWVPNRKLYKKN